MGWQIAWEGEALAEGDLTLDEIGTVCDLADIAWVSLHPLRHPRHLRAIVAVLKARSGADAQAVYRELGSMKGGEAIANIKDVPDDLPTMYENGLPKAEDGPATTGSSGAPSSTTGRPTSPDDSESATSNS